MQVKHYHADNGRFGENLFMAHIARCGQTISFCGVNAHFQNGKAERRIRTLQELARSQILHAKAKWPAAITTNLWPYAVSNVSSIMNDTMAADHQLSRIERFTNSRVRPRLAEHHHFGTPVYVLQNDLQSGKKIGKWMPRARIGIYLCKSPRHARSVSLILNPRTGMVSPQYHMKFDDTFGTVAGNKVDEHGLWIDKCGFRKDESRSKGKIKQSSVSERLLKVIRNVPTEHPEDLEEDIAPIPDQIEQDNQEIGNEADFDIENDLDARVIDQDEIPVYEGAPLPREEPIRRSARNWQPTARMLESMQQEDLALTSFPITSELLHYDPYEDMEIDIVNPILLLSNVEEDTMYWDQAMKSQDKDQFLKAAMAEIESHEVNQHWKVVPISEIPTNVPILDSVWSMKRKRKLRTNEIYKWKARLNIHGGQQEYGINYWETYAPVVTWAAIRMLLTLTLIYGWYTRQIDFVLAYPQADVECELYMKIPKGFTIQCGDQNTHALKLIKNLYGQKQAGRVWNQHLHSQLIKMGWKQSTADDCVYYWKNVIFCVYVDDGILVSPYNEELNQAIKLIKSSFNITEEIGLSDYVGVNIDHKSDGTIHMTQPQLINSIIKELNFQNDTKIATSPALTTKILDAGKKNEPHNAEWHYRRIIGKLNFLEKSCRPDIACAVHQAARFSSNPRQNHTEAVKRIARYLKGTMDKGIIYKPTTHSFEVWVDADFCGLWNRETAIDDPSTSKSRTGYVITYAGCPIIWASQLQTEIAQSTTESEYIALSTALRQTIPLMRLIAELKTTMKLELDTTPKIHCKLFEDNSGAIELAHQNKVPSFQTICFQQNDQHHQGHYGRTDRRYVNKTFGVGIIYKVQETY